MTINKNDGAQLPPLRYEEPERHHSRHLKPNHCQFSAQLCAAASHVSGGPTSHAPRRTSLRSPPGTAPRSTSVRRWRRSCGGPPTPRTSPWARRSVGAPPPAPQLQRREAWCLTAISAHVKATRSLDQEILDFGNTTIGYPTSQVNWWKILHL